MGHDHDHSVFDPDPLFTGLWTASAQGQLARCKELISRSQKSVNSKDESGYTALHYACRGGHEKIVSELLRAGADVHAQTQAMLATPLHRVAYTGHHPILCSLLKEGASPNTPDADGMTPLHKAYEQGHENCIRELLLAGADEQCLDNKGRTPKACATTLNG